jgi:hypothetical protein
LTAFAVSTGFLSEPGSSSDNFSSSARDFVRTQLYFGQLFFSCTNFCPNLGHLRTTFLLLHEILFELCSTSDNFFCSARNLVRTWLYFGQLFLFCTRFCPNLALLRTTFPLLHEILSELGSTSDNFFCSARNLVRTQLYFGQLFSVCTRFCPNSALLRTTFHLLNEILAELGSTSDNFSSSARDFGRTWVSFGQLFLSSARFCQNLALLRTTFLLLHEFLSEPGSSSDNFSSSARDFVRTLLYFGQLFLFSTKPCPNLAILRTTFPLLHEILSEPGSTSDNFSSSARDFVRTWLYFGQLFLFCTRFCPNSALLRTTFPLMREILSELGSTSDNFSSPE